MHTTDTRQSYFEIDNFEDKHFFATFFNQARHNAYNILNIIEEVMRLKPETEENEKPIEEASLWKDSRVIKELCEGDPRKQQGIIELLDRWLPFVIIKNRNNPKNVGQRLKSYLWLLNNYRNYFSHFYHVPFGMVPFSPWDFKKKETKDVFLVDLNKEFSAYWTKSRELLDKHFATVFSFKDKKHLEKFIFIEKNKFTRDGLLYFVCLFLEVDDINRLLSRTKFFKGTHNNKMRATREAFARLACKLPRPKVHSTDEKQSLMLDILNELAKAPKGVYDHMVEAEKAKLFIDIQEEFVTLEDGTNDFRRIEMRRKRDRFPYFALKFLEVSGRLPNLLFHLNLGKRLVKPIYQKEILGQKEDRRLTKEILTFGHLKDFREPISLFPQYIRDTEGVNLKGEPILHLEAPLEQFRPKYHFSQERIGVRFKSEHDSVVPDLIENKPLKPDFFISLNDLPKLVMMCLKHDDVDVENFFRKKLKNKITFYDDVISGKLKPLAYTKPIPKQGNSDHDELQSRFDEIRAIAKISYQITLSEIPEKVRDYLVVQSHLTQRDILLSKMRSAMEDASIKAELCKNDKLMLKKGQMATLLARDIVKFYDPIVDSKNGKGRVKKLNSTQYQLLQSKLAYFVVSKDDLIKLFTEFEIFSRHKFVNKKLFNDIKIKGKMEPIGIKKFFRNYFEAKANWLEQEVKKLESNQAINNLRQKYYMFELYNQELDGQGLYKPEFIAKYLKGLKKMPFYLARSSFDQFLAYDEGDNFVKWMEKDCKGAKQWFYHADVLDKETNVKTKHQRDKIIRHELTKDRVLWEMAKMLSDNDMKMALDEASLSKYEYGNNILDERVDVVLKLQLEQKRMKQFSKKISANIKLKDYGSLRKYIKDRRLPGLLSYYKAKDIPIEVVKSELNNYENNRSDVLKGSFAVEKKLYELFPEKFDNKPFINFTKQLTWKGNESSDIWKKANRSIIGIYRNHYLHNKIPVDVAIKHEDANVVGLINSEIMRKFAEMLADF